MDRSKFVFSVYIDTPWQIDEDAAAMYLKQAIEDSVLGLGTDIEIDVKIKAPLGAEPSVGS